MRGLLAMLLTSACTEPFDRLSEFDHVVHAFAATTLAEEPKVGVSVLTSSTGRRQCPQYDIEELRASFGGIELTYTGITFVEGYYDGGAPHGSYCDMGFQAPQAPLLNGVVAVSDSSMDIVATFEQSSLEMRTATHPDWTFARGEAVAIQWFPAADFGDSRADVRLVPSDVPLDVISSPSRSPPTIHRGLRSRASRW